MATNKVETLSSNLFIYSPYSVSFTFLILFYNPDLIYLLFTYRKNLVNIWNQIFAVSMWNILRFIALATKNGLVERGNIHIFMRNVNCYKPKENLYLLVCAFTLHIPLCSHSWCSFTILILYVFDLPIARLNIVDRVFQGNLIRGEINTLRAARLSYVRPILIWNREIDWVHLWRKAV